LPFRKVVKHMMKLGFGTSLLMVLQIWFRSLFRTAKPVYEPRFPAPKWRELTRKARDGVNLKIRVSVGGGKKVMLLAEPLGQQGPSIYDPITVFYGPEYTYVTWDYRGFFESGTPDMIRRISIPEHAQDAVEVLEEAGFARADVMVGHSMGTAVAFETVVCFPEKVGAVVIINGFHGHCFSTAFQPLMRIPFVGDGLCAFVDLQVNNPAVLEFFYWRLGLPFLRAQKKVMQLISGSKLLRSVQGEDYVSQFADSYFGGVFGTQQNLQSWLRLFQELDAHSVWHLLPLIRQPMLIISGLWDPLTPAMQSVEIARRVPHAVHYCDPYSTHASLVENPERIVAEVQEFLENLPESATAEKRD